MRSVRIHPARNHLGSLLMVENHLYDLGGAPDYDGHDRNQPDSQIQYRPHVFIFLIGRSPFALGRWHLALANDDRLTTNNGSLVELTGIEPVASWLQTRRSPS
jgi:hypothetical protein